MFDEEPRPATAFRISINGKRFCESDNLTTLTMSVDEVRRGNRQRITLYARAREGALQWMTADLAAGDSVAIEVVDIGTQDDSTPHRCDYCGREAHDVSAMVAGKSASICDLCITGFSTALHEGGALPVGASVRDDPEWPCRFCGKTSPDVPGVVVRNGAAVCPECLRTGRDILSDRPGMSPHDPDSDE